MPSPNSDGADRLEQLMRYLVLARQSAADSHLETVGYFIDMAIHETALVSALRGMPPEERERLRSE